MSEVQTYVCRQVPRFLLLGQIGLVPLLGLPLQIALILQLVADWPTDIHSLWSPKREIQQVHLEPG